MDYRTNLFNRGTGVPFVPFTLTNDVNTLKANYTTLNNNYISTSNLGNNLRSAYSNEFISFNAYYNGNVMLNTKVDGIRVASNLSIDSNLIIGSNIIVNHNDTQPAISLKNGENYTLLTKAQIKFSYNGLDTYSHYIHTTHSATPSRARMDLLVCSGSATNDISTNTSNVMSLVGNGRVGIGTTTPNSNLDVIGTGSFSSNLQTNTTIFSEPNTSYGSLNITGTERNLYQGYVINNSSGYIDSLIYHGIYDFKNSQWAFYQKKSTGMFYLVGDLYLPASQSIGIGTQTPSYRIHLSTDSAAKPSTTTWTVSSDIRLKKNIEVADYDRCYNIMSNLDLKKYSWRDDILELSDEFIKDRSKLGWIADDVKNYFPKAVNVITEAYGLSNVLDLNSDQIYACMYGTIKFLMVQVEDFASKFKEFAQQIEDLKKRINVLEKDKKLSLI